MASYDTYTNADSYFENRLHVLAWNDASNSEKTVALTEASQRIDRLRFRGSKVSSTQDLAFPRYYGDDPTGLETIPDDIKIASYEIAYALLDGVDPELELENLGINTQAFSGARVKYDNDAIPEHLAAGIPSAHAWRYLKPYLGQNNAVKLRRTS